jgi:4-hydroxy-2-oxoglutarate aldolase
MDDIKAKLSGVFAPLVTPFENDEILFDALAENVRRLNTTGLRGYLVLGTNGEFRALSVEERFRVLETVLASTSRDKTIIAGTGAESTKETIDLTLKAAKMEIHMATLLPPHFFVKRMDDIALIEHVIAVAEVSPVPVMLYNNPSVSAGLTASPNVIREISGHPNVVGLKDSSKGNFEQYIEVAQRGFSVLAGSANFFLDLLEKGGSGGVLSLANVVAEACVEVYQLYQKGEIKEAWEKQHHLVTVNQMVSGTYGVAGVKAAMNIAGFKGGEPRRPLRPLTTEEKADLKERLSETGFFTS